MKSGKLGALKFVPPLSDLKVANDCRLFVYNLAIGQFPLPLFFFFDNFGARGARIPP
jgi:hypothetical protein